LLLYPWLVQKKGYRWCITVGLLVVMMAVFPFPLYGLMADPATFGSWRMLPRACLMVVQQSAFGFCMPSCTLWVNRFAAGLDRGSINGLTNSFAALCRALAPEFCSALLSLGLRSGLPFGRYLPVYVAALAGVAILLLSRSALPMGPPGQLAKVVDVPLDGAEHPGVRHRAVTWWQDVESGVMARDEDLIEAAGLAGAASARRFTW
jgi:hypothetical protein